MREAGFNYADFEKKGVLAPVVEAHCNYKFPAQYNDMIIIKTTIESVGTSSIKFRYKILRKEDQKLLADGYTVNVFIDKDKMQPTQIPDELKEALQ